MSLVDRLSDALPSVAVRPEEELRHHTTYRVGGPAELLVEVNSDAEVRRVAQSIAGHCAAGGEVPPITVVGKGSNLLVADTGIAGVVILVGAGLAWIDIEGDQLRAGGGASLPVAARKSVGRGLTGFEWAVGVPGSIGGAVRMNAGGHGSDVAASLLRCTVIDLVSGEERILGPDDLAFSYRHSAIGPTSLVMEATFSLAYGDRDEGEALLSEIVKWRREHQPGGANAGSVFRNPPGDSAGRLIDMAGLRGWRRGGASVSDKHANFILVDPGGTADDVKSTLEASAAAVEERYGVMLEAENVMVGFEGVTVRRPRSDDEADPGPGSQDDPVDG